MSLISTLNMAQQAMMVNQAAITTISNNIANVDTPGYSRLRINQAALINNTPSAGNAISLAESCSGVTITSVQRYSDIYLQNYYRQESSTASYLQEYSAIASNIENLTNELNDTGLAEALNNFYAAADALNDDPSDITARENYVQQAQNVTAVFNTTYKGLMSLKTSLVGDPSAPGTLESSEIYSDVEKVNSLLDQIADVNYDIIRTNSGESYSTSLLDKRDQLVNQLSEMIPVDVSENSNHTVKITLGDYDLVAGTKISAHLSVSSGNYSNPVSVNLVNPEGTANIATNVNSSIDSGTLGAILVATKDSTGSNLTLNSTLKSLNDLAYNFADVLNSIQTKVGYPDSDGTTPLAIDSDTGKLMISTEKLFVTSDASATINAGNISINSKLINDPNLVAAARLDLTKYTNPSQYENSIGNNANATLILNSRNTTVEDLGNMTVENYLASMVSGIGLDVDNINTSYENQTSVLSEVETQLNSAIGVNLDEELVDLIKYQRAYQAAARVFSVCNDLMDVLVHLGE